MEEEIDDIVGDVKYTDSQKSVATSIMYSQDFTDSSSDKNNSSGKETYVIEWDSEDSSTEKMYSLHNSNSVINLNQERSLTPLESNTLTSRHTSSLQKCAIVAQEIYTQTSKTIIELAETEGTLIRSKENKTLETQTSFLSITENKTIEYRIQVSNSQNITNTEIPDKLDKKPAYYNITCNQVFTDSLDDASSKFPISITDTEFEITEDNRSDSSSNDQIIKLIKDDSKEIILNEENFENTSDDNDSDPNTDMEEDSLIANGDRKSANSAVLELHEKLFENTDLPVTDRFGGSDLLRFGTLTPLTEESAAKRDSLMDITPVDNMMDSIAPVQDETLFTNNTGMKVKLLKEDSLKTEKDAFKLPPIQNQSCPTSPHLNSLFSVNKQKLNKAGTLPCLYERQRDNMLDRWEIGSKNLASGESPMINGRSESPRKDGIQLPPIRTDSSKNSPTSNNRGEILPTNVVRVTIPSESHEPICIKDKIKELKMSSKRPWNNHTRHGQSHTESRSNSPGSTSPPEGGRLCDIADRGCEVLCVELLRRLGSTSWFDVTDTLQEIPRVLEKFWGVISETRIADLIRQVMAHVESPRTQVSRAACSTCAAILKNTNYTKKPEIPQDFHEAVSLLLVKTGSYCRPVRRAANVALDDVVCGVDLTHAVSALSIHGVEHKNALVRCASARLLVVCCALASGGRDLLRARPASAASARKHVLRSLAALLEDKSTDTRKYAERLYAMLRPLANFEAYYLTDVDIDTASKQMKKYDQLVFGPKENR